MKHSVSSLCLVFVLLICGTHGETLQEERSKSSAYKSSLQHLATHGKFAHNKNPKFLGAHVADWIKFPYTVAILDSNGLLISGGAIIAEDYVLTSQDRVGSENPWEIKVLANNNVEKRVSYIFEHWIYRVGALAVLKLESKFDLSGPNITSIELASDTVPVGTNCTLVGVGGSSSLFEPTPPEDVLHFMNLPTVALTVCKNWWYRDNLNDEHLCASHYKDEPPIKCQPNTGDPLVCNGILTGVGSVLNNCGNETESGIYGNVAYHRAWIKEQMGHFPESTEETTTQHQTSTTKSTGTSTTEAPDTTTPNTAALRTSSYSTVAALLIATISILFRSVVGN